MNVAIKVIDQNGHPVPGVKVDVFLDEGTQVARNQHSDASGEIALSNKTPCAGHRLKFVASKDGYEKLEHIHHPHSDSVKVNLEMKGIVPPPSNGKWGKVAIGVGAVLVVMAVLFIGLNKHPKRTPEPPRPRQVAPTTPDPVPVPPRKPRIDVIVSDIQAPSTPLRRNQPFDLTIELKNNQLSGPTAGVLRVEMRAKFRGPRGTMDVPLTSDVVFRNLEPQRPQRRVVEITAPHSPGGWILRAIIVPLDFEDPVNNERVAKIVVK